MTDPISSTRGGASAACDPTLACCEEAAAPADAAAPPPPQPKVVTIPPVYIMGDASQQLAKEYDKRAAEACKGARASALAGCPSIASNAIEGAVVSAFSSSLMCAQLISAYDDCKGDAEARLKFADRCEALGKVPVPSARPGEYFCIDR